MDTKRPQHIPMPTNKIVYIGYMALLLPTIFWFFHFLDLLGIRFPLELMLQSPRFVIIAITVVFPIISFIFGSITYLEHPAEKRKLVYQSLIVVSIFYILSIIVYLIDGDIM